MMYDEKKKVGQTLPCKVKNVKTPSKPLFKKKKEKKEKEEESEVKTRTVEECFLWNEKAAVHFESDNAPINSQ